MDFGLMFFSSNAGSSMHKYYLLLEAAKYADEHNFCCVWTPERHFNEFGGIFPNPAITSVALAMVTQRLQLRAGSLISPLHDVIRIAEEWAVVDNLSNGRVAISFGSGWNANDFVFFPARYHRRRDVMYEQIQTLKKLWRGECIVRPNSFGNEIRVVVHPKPLQPSLPIWVTSSGDPETFKSAGAIGANVLTHLVGQNIESLAEKIHIYRDARACNGCSPEEGIVSVMLHTFLGPDVETVREKVRLPLREYLRSAVLLENAAAMGGGTVSGGRRVQPHEMPPDVMEELLDITFDRYFNGAALLGTPERCRPLVRQLSDIGVNEIACLIDFGVQEDDAMAGIEYLNTLSLLSAGRVPSACG